MIKSKCKSTWYSQFTMICIGTEWTLFFSDFHEKCYGNFFCPEDQKMSRMDSLEHEYVEVCTKTNYAGYVYWGEYSLCFAAVLNQEECFRLILSRGINLDMSGQISFDISWLFLSFKGGNPDLVDTNGNTITHIMVIYDNMRMFDLALECGATMCWTVKCKQDG